MHEKIAVDDVSAQRCAGREGDSSLKEASQSTKYLALMLVPCRSNDYSSEIYANIPKDMVCASSRSAKGVIPIKAVGAPVGPAAGADETGRNATL